MARIGELLDPVQNPSTNMKERLEQGRRHLQPNRPIDPIEMLLMSRGCHCIEAMSGRWIQHFRGSRNRRYRSGGSGLLGLGDYLDPRE